MYGAISNNVNIAIPNNLTIVNLNLRKIKGTINGSKAIATAGVNVGKEKLITIA